MVFGSFPEGIFWGKMAKVKKVFWNCRTEELYCSGVLQRAGGVEIVSTFLRKNGR
jgi:hypothetical protein